MHSVTHHSYWEPPRWGRTGTRSFPSSRLLWVSPPSKLSTTPHQHSSVEFQFYNSYLATEPPNSTWVKPGQPRGEDKLTRVFTQAPIPSRSWSNLVLTKPKCANTKTKPRVSPCATPRRSGKPPITIRKGYLPLSITVIWSYWIIWNITLRDVCFRCRGTIKLLPSIEYRGKRNRSTITNLWEKSEDDA